MASDRAQGRGPSHRGIAFTRRHCLQWLGVLAALSWPLVGGCSGALSGSAGGKEEAQDWFAPLSSQVDWQPQDYVDSQGIRAVRGEPGRLVVDAHLVGGHPHYSQGEIFLDLQYVPGFEGRTPLDLQQRTITVTVEVPSAFRGWSANRNGVQVFVKDHGGRSQYGRWVDILAGGRYTATLQPSTRAVPGGYMECGFNPAAIRLLGVKFGIGTASAATYDGPLVVTGCSLTPSLPLRPPPPLPAAPPPPAWQPGDTVVARRDGLYLRGSKWFVVGANWRGLDYGQNFGANAWFPTGNGIAKHPQFVWVQLGYMQRAGLKVVRVGLLDDGRTVFDKEGSVTQYDAIFRRDVQTFLQLAQEAQLKVEFTLVDFLIAGQAEEIPIAGKTAECNRVWLRGRAKLITEPQRREEFLQAFLIPFLHEFGQHPAVLGFDVINEPEWVIAHQDGGGWERVKDVCTKAPTSVPGPQMQAFITACIHTIHRQAPGKLVTVGVSAPFLALLSPLPLDYVALHHYPWMGDLQPYLRALPPGKPWVLEEYPTNQAQRFQSPDPQPVKPCPPPTSGQGCPPPEPRCVPPADEPPALPMSLAAYLELVSTTGGAGALLWNFSPGIDPSTFTHDQRDRLLQECRRWIDSHAEAIWPGGARP